MDLVGFNMKTPTTTIIGRKISLRRQKKDIKINKVAKAAGLSIAVLSKIEKGEMIPDQETIEKIARGLGVNSGWLNNLEAMKEVNYTDDITQ